MRGYTCLGAGFDVENDVYDGWNHWPGVASTAFPDTWPQVAMNMKALWAQGKDSPYACRGVGVCVRFLEACEAYSKSSTASLGEEVGNLESRFEAS